MSRWVVVGLLAIGLVLVNGVVRSTGPAVPSDSQASFQMVSGWFWLQGYGAWLSKDEQRLRDYYSYATAFDPTHLNYWRLAAQTLAFDVPTWNETGSRSMYGKEALSFFERSRPYFTESSEWFQTGAFLAEIVVQDSDLAIRYLEEGVAKESHSFLLGRRYARLLRERGDSQEALAFLKEWLPRLENDPYPERYREMSEWIMSLEKELDSSHSE